MHPLTRNIVIGAVVAACVAGAVGATWWFGTQNDTLAARLPAEAVIAYATATEHDLSDLALSALYPSLPPAPEPEDGGEAMALVQTTDGTVGWMTLVRKHGRSRVHGSDPALESLLQDLRPSLADDAAFRTLHAAEPGWIYVTVPRDAPPVASVIGPFVTLDSPIALRQTGGGFDVRVALRPTPRLNVAPVRPLILLPETRHVLRIPSWNALAALGGALTDDAAAVAESLASTFLANIAPGLSLRYDVSPLLHGQSLAQLGEGDRFAFEGSGKTPADTDRILRAIHERFGATNGSAEIRTVTAEGQVLRTLTGEGGSATTERTDGTWTVLETRAGNAVLLSAHEGARFVVTDDEEAFGKRAESELTIVGSGIARTEGALALLWPFWPDLEPGNQTLGFRLTDGPGYVEWSVQGL